MSRPCTSSGCHGLEHQLQASTIHGERGLWLSRTPGFTRPEGRPNVRSARAARPDGGALRASSPILRPRPSGGPTSPTPASTPAAPRARKSAGIRRVQRRQEFRLHKGHGAGQPECSIRTCWSALARRPGDRPQPPYPPPQQQGLQLPSPWCLMDPAGTLRPGPTTANLLSTPPQLAQLAAPPRRVEFTSTTDSTDRLCAPGKAVDGVWAGAAIQRQQASAVVPFRLAIGYAGRAVCVAVIGYGSAFLLVFRVTSAKARRAQWVVSSESCGLDIIARFP